MHRAHVWVLTVMLAFLPSAGALALEAGAAERDITPEPGLAMAGFTNRVSHGVLDSIHVRALALRSGNKSLVLVCYDLLFPFARQVNAELRDSIRSRTGVQEVFFSSTHTHSGPAIFRGPQLPPGQSIKDMEPHERMICSQTIEAVAAAVAAMTPVAVGSGQGAVDLSYRRVQPQPDGRVEMIWSNHEKKPLGPADPTVAVVRLDRLDNGKPLAILVNYACHPVIFGASNQNLAYSADFPGVLYRKVRARLPGAPLCIFFNGCPGDLNPYYAHSVDDPLPRLEEVGGTLAAEVLRVAGGITTKACDSPLALSSSRKYFPSLWRWDLDNWQAHQADSTAQPGPDSSLAQKGEMQLPLDVALLTPEIGFVGLPGEFFSRFQGDIRSKSPVPFLIVAAYTEGSYGYFPTLEAAVTGGYGANDTGTHVAVGAGERMSLEALVSLHELLGGLRDFPANPDRGYRY
ncbi:neutral/alkaline non-lysosomal ceramidase N-terminal domain-containing protein [bacterium]|nr:neutral/alkaline non-lysosomal ceramidase N-terminal domain-containing protein [bacterium]